MISVVGEKYLVPTVDGLPVVGTPHRDTEPCFGDVPKHYHVDSRFSDQFDATIRNSKPVLQEHTCIRDTPNDWSIDLQKSAIFAYLTVLLSNKRSVCGKCPHQGMPIQNGVCSGHRTKWNGDTPKYLPPFELELPEINQKVVINTVDDFKNILIVNTGDLSYFRLYNRDRFICEVKLKQSRSVSQGMFLHLYSTLPTFGNPRRS